MTFTRTFQRERETKNTIRFSEVTEESQPFVMGTLYVQKWAVGATAQITVTIDVETAEVAK